MCDDNRLQLSRRGLLAAGVATAFAGGLALPAAAQGGGPATLPNAIGPDEVLKRLMDGNARYAANSMNNKDFSADRAARAAAQYPIAGIVSCADSRVAPELAFDQGPGELFVIRLAGNFVNDDGLASLEYGAKFLGIPLIMVLGHSNCGAVAATIKVVKENAELPGHLPALVKSIKPAVAMAEKNNKADSLDAVIADNVRYNVQKLKDSKPIIADLVAKNKLKIVGGVYDIGTGKVTVL